MTNIVEHLNNDRRSSIYPTIFAFLLAVIAIIGGATFFMVKYEVTKLITSFERMADAQIKANTSIELMQNDIGHMVVNYNKLEDRVRVVEDFQKDISTRRGTLPGSLK